MIRSRQPFPAPRMRLLSGGKRTWLQRFLDVEELFEFKMTLLVAVTLLGASLGV